MMNPAFTHSNIKSMIPSFTRMASLLINLIEDKVNSGESNIALAPYISKATLDIIGLVGFNYEFNSLSSPNDLANAYSSIVSSLTPLRYMIGRLASYFPLIRKAEFDDLKGADLLSVLININKTFSIEERMTDDELKNQIMTFLLAGHETTSITTSWALYLLAQHPHVQDLLREELVKAFPDKSNFNPTFDEINSLELLNCVTKEVLRLHPPVGLIRRTNLKDKVFGNYLIPKNTQITLSILALHKSPEIWGPTAAEFDPKRWLNPELTKNVSNISYLPFNTGARGCIGNKLALNEIKVILGILVRNFVFQTIEGTHIERKSFTSAKPTSDIELTITKVES
ncbi:cytochrome P450 [Rhizophagus clarus]|nr:cytochrome P450 [Rhizophagus clarus]